MTLKSQVSRAELLYWVAESNNSHQILEETVELLGFQHPTHRLAKKIAETDDKEPAELALEQPNLLRNPAEATPKVNFYYLANRQRYASEAEARKTTPHFFDQVESIADTQLNDYWQSQTPLSPIPLTREARITPFLRRELRQVVGKRLDVKKLIKRIAYQQPLNEIPTQPHLLPAGRVIVIADLNPRLLPFWSDIDAVCALIKQKHGKIGLECRVLAKDEPRNDYYHYDDWRKQQLKQQRWKKIPAQSLVFIISDLGQLTANNSLIYQRWLSFVQRLNRRGIRPIVLAPIAAEKQCPQLQALTQQILWQTSSDFKPTQQRGDVETYEKKLKRIISFLSLSPHIEAILLRALCHILPIQEGHSGIEADIYLHSDVQWGYSSISIQADKREYYQALFNDEEVAIQQQVFNTIQQHHSHQFPSVWAETVLNADVLMPVDSDLVEQAEQLMLRFTKRYYTEQHHQGLQQFAKRHLKRLQKQQHKNKSYASAFYGLAYRQQLLAGEEIPAEYDKKIINQLLKQASRQKSYQLRQRGERLLINLMSEEEKNKRLMVEYGQCLASFKCEQNSVMLNQQMINLPLSSKTAIEIPSIQGLKELTIQIDTGQECLTVKTLQKPSWADEIGFAENGLYVLYQQHYIVYPSWAEFVDVDESGLFADLCFNGVTQRFRAILAGTFMMGSPKNEVGRSNNEDYHQVTLSKGYWLADTACTQALWQVVMEKNPAEFNNDSQNPIETVSWLDIQAFLQKLNQHLPNLQAQLPSEAQWEYACRAGTTTPFSFGENITPEQVNYNGNYPYADGKKGEDRSKTVAVKSLPANQWGLYQMHGNVWEWCADEWQSSLGTSPVLNPVNIDVKLDNDRSVGRVIRGGSWGLSGGGVRSAYRDWFKPGFRDLNLGFRLLLGHELQPSQLVSRSDNSSKVSGQTEHDPARRGAAQGHDQAGSGWIDKVKKIVKPDRKTDK